MSFMEETRDRIADAQLLASGLVLAMRGYFGTDADADASVLEALALKCSTILDDLVADTAPSPAFVTIELTAIGEKKIEVIKVVREFTGLGLKEAKELVEAAPIALNEHFTVAHADKFKQALEAVGASVMVV
jgi:large subunit ribosomal protein L7/L12